ncbi:MAG: PAS domain-containing protein [Parvibaculum sp.]|nr:PAS domain-containing protein [Parvibaculum sp.]
MAAGKSRRVENSACLVEPGELSDPAFGELLSYWEARRCGRDMPARADIDPVHFPRLLPRVFMVRVDHDPLAFVYSLAGGENVEAHGRNFTGMDVRDLDGWWPGYGSSLHEFYSLVVHGGVPLAASGTMNFVDREFRAFEAIYLPLAAQDGEVGHIMGAALYGPVEAAA